MPVPIEAVQPGVRLMAETPWQDQAADQIYVVRQDSAGYYVIPLGGIQARELPLNAANTHYLGFRLADSSTTPMVRALTWLCAKPEFNSATLRQTLALLILAEPGRHTNATLRVRLNCPAPAITRVIALLEGFGLVQTTPDQIDGRKILYSLTPFGQNMVQGLEKTLNPGA